MYYNIEFQLELLLLPRSTHTHARTLSLSLSLSSVIKTNRLMQYGEIIVINFEIHIIHVNTLHGQNVDFLMLNTNNIK